MLIFILLFWLVLPLVVAYRLAKKKNRTKSGWLIATFFFGWFAVLFLAVKEKHYGGQQ